MMCTQAAIGNSRRTDDELEQLSVVREPRQRDSSPYNTSKVSLFATYILLNVSFSLIHIVFVFPNPAPSNGESPPLQADELPKFSEWAAGRQASLDTDTLSKHVKQMVDVSTTGSLSAPFLYPPADNFSLFLSLSRPPPSLSSYYRLCFEHMTRTTRAVSARESLTQYHQTFRLLSVFQFLIKMSESGLKPT